MKKCWLIINIDLIHLFKDTHYKEHIIFCYTRLPHIMPSINVFSKYSPFFNNDTLKNQKMLTSPASKNTSYTLCFAITQNYIKLSIGKICFRLFFFFHLCIHLFIYFFKSRSKRFFFFAIKQKLKFIWDCSRSWDWSTSLWSHTLLDRCLKNYTTLQNIWTYQLLFTRSVTYVSQCCVIF